MLRLVPLLAIAFGCATENVPADQICHTGDAIVVSATCLGCEDVEHTSCTASGADPLRIDYVIETRESRGVTGCPSVCGIVDVDCGVVPAAEVDVEVDGFTFTLAAGECATF